MFFSAVVLSTALFGCNRPDPRVDVAEEILRTMDSAARIEQVVALLPTAADSLVFSATPPVGQSHFSEPGVVWLEDADASLVARVRAWTGARSPALLTAGPISFSRDSNAPDVGFLPIANASEFWKQGSEALLAAGIDLPVLSFASEKTSSPEPDSVAVAESIAQLSRAAFRSADRVALSELLLRPLAALPDGLVAGVTTGNLAIPAWTGDLDLPSALSPAVGKGIFRRDLGWEGLVIADLRTFSNDLSDVALAISALEAGNDLLLPRGDRPALVRALVDSLQTGGLDSVAVDQAARRVILTRIRVSEESLPRETRATEPTTSPTATAFWTANWATPGIQIGDPDSLGMSTTALRGVDSLIEEAIEDSVITAAAIAVGRRGQLAWLAGFGELDGGRTVDPARTLFDLASLSKVVGTTTAAALLVADGTLDLDEPIAEYLPAFEGGDRGQVTPRHLLSHTSGLPAGLWLYGSADSPEEAVEQALAADLTRPPGEIAEYSDLGMIILAHLIEILSGEPLDQLLSRRLFLPLGMTRTMYLPPAVFAQDVVPTAVESERPYPLRAVVHDGNAFRLGGVAGHAGIFSTALDVGAFVRMISSGGAADSVQILDPSVLADFLEPYPGAEGRALGWDTPDDRSSAGRFFSERAFGHTGYTGTSIWVDPAQDLFVVLLTNRTFTGASAGDMLDLRIAVHEAIARAITDQTLRRRPGSR